MDEASPKTRPKMMVAPPFAPNLTNIGRRQMSDFSAADLAPEEEYPCDVARKPFVRAGGWAQPLGEDDVAGILPAA